MIRTEKNAMTFSAWKLPKSAMCGPPVLTQLQKSGLVSFSLLVTLLVLNWLLISVLTLYGEEGSNIPQESAAVHKVELDSKPPYPSDTADNIFWFVQLSDLHISKFNHFERATDLVQFCKHHLSVLKPSLVLITGDLVDAKMGNGIGSMQYKEEWMTYQTTMKLCRRSCNTTWLDVRGNHDGFASGYRTSPGNLYRKHGISAEKFQDGITMQHVMKFGFGTYLFNGVDLTPNPGAGRPFNFFGIVTKDDLRSIEQLSRKSSGNLTVWFGHYPLSMTTTPSALRNIIGRSAAYLCGHLHTQNNHFHTMLARQPQGYLELELADWSAERRYRIMAVDHDIFTFIDVSMEDRLVILITNPKPAHFIADNGEKLDRMAKSTHIRFLVFTDSPVFRSLVYIDDVLLCGHAVNIRGPLFACAWNSLLYAHGFHSLKVQVEDLSGRSATSEISFSLDGNALQLPWKVSVLLLGDIANVIRIVYYCLFFVTVIVPMTLHVLKLTNNAKVLCNLPMLRDVMRFVCCQQLFYPMAAYSTFLCLGPHFFGELVPGSIGVCFLFGLYSNGRWLEEAYIYVMAASHLIYYNIPVMYIIGAMMRRDQSNCRRFVQGTMLCYITVNKLNIARQHLHAYGSLAFLTSFGELWAVPFLIFLLYRVVTIRRIILNM